MRCFRRSATGCGRAGIVSVENASGERVHQVHVEREQILSEQVAFQMVTMLQDVVDRGTGASARRLGVRGPFGGKTGSTNDYRDAWFVGFSSSVVVGVWVGFDQPERIQSRRLGRARRAADLGRLHAARLGRLPAEPIAPPADLRSEELCLISYQRAVEGCPTYIEHFKEGDEIPSRLCTVHAGSLKQQVQKAVQGLFGALGRGIRGIFK